MDQYLLVERHIRTGREQRTLYRYVWYSMSRGLLAETTVDNSFRNWRRRGWEALAQDTAPWGIYSELEWTDRVTREGMPVITADSRPRLEQRLSRQLALEVMAQDHADRQAASQPWHRLFDMDHGQ